MSLAYKILALAGLATVLEVALAMWVGARLERVASALRRPDMDADSTPRTEALRGLTDWRIDD